MLGYIGVHMSGIAPRRSLAGRRHGAIGTTSKGCHSSSAVGRLSRCGASADVQYVHEVEAYQPEIDQVGLRGDLPGGFLYVWVVVRRHGVDGMDADGCIRRC